MVLHTRHEFRILANPHCRERQAKICILTRYGLYQFLRIPFGLSNAPATFQRAMHAVLAGLIWISVIVYLDDINVMGHIQETMENLEVVLDRFRQAGLKLKPRKCGLFRQEVKFLGRVVNPQGVQVTTDHVKAVTDWTIPKCRKDLDRRLRGKTTTKALRLEEERSAMLDLPKQDYEARRVEQRKWTVPTCRRHRSRRRDPRRGQRSSCGHACPIRTPSCN